MSQFILSQVVRFAKCYFRIYLSLALAAIVPVFLFQLVFRIDQFDGYENILPRFGQAMLALLPLIAILMIGVFVLSLMTVKETEPREINLIERFLQANESFIKNYLGWRR